MPAKVSHALFYKLEDGYKMTKLEGAECSLIFRNGENEVVAVLNGCDQKITLISPYHERELTLSEKDIIRRFVLTQKYGLNIESAEYLGLSVVRYRDGKEEYLTENQLKKRLKAPLNNVHLHVGSLKKHTLDIPPFSRGGMLNLSRAEIKKIIIGNNCDLLIDMRDNRFVEALRVGESFNGSINMSRNTVESIVVGNNCRCDLSVNESKHCFTLNIADVYSGNLNIRNSCFHSLNIGYYCYASVRLGDNWGRRDIVVGDSFRGSLNIDNVNVYSVRIGKDCKGKISISSKSENYGNRKIRIDDDFAGILDLRDAKSVEQVELGQRARGKVNLLGCSGVKVVKFDKYFSGYADFSESSVEYVRAGYGYSGDMVLLGCDNLTLLKLPRHKDNNITIERDPLNVTSSDNSLYYRFSSRQLPGSYFTPFYKRIYQEMRNTFSGSGE